MEKHRYPRVYTVLIALLLAFLLVAPLASCGGPLVSSPSPSPVLSPVTGVTPSPSSSQAKAPDASQARNVILLIGDGMGLSQITLGRLYGGNKPLALDGMQAGTAATYPTGSPKWITDSAAAGTAIACGVKTYIAAIGVDADKKEVPSILELAKQSGRATGVISTMSVTNATPACFTAHDPSRRAETEIALDQLALQPDILMGGGLGTFLPKAQGGAREDGRDLTAEFKNAGYTLATNANELSQASGRILGLFAPGFMDYEIDRQPESPSLQAMTQKALEELGKAEKGFFLMVEGGKIDQASHVHDAPTAGAEVLSFDAAVQAALDFAKADGHTLVIVTADHETGGCAIGSTSQSGVYNYSLLKGQKASIYSTVMGMDFKSASPPDMVSLLEDTFGLKNVTGAEKQQLEKAYQQQKSGASSAVNRALAAVMSARIGAGWTTDDHTGADVMVFSYGPGSGPLCRHIDNTDIFKCMKAAMGI